MSRFMYCFHKVLGHEGGFANHRYDRGGRTNYGVTQKTYDEFCRSVGRETCDVRDIAMDEVELIYFRYWRDAGCDRLPEPLDLFVFDCAINSGVPRAIKLLQRALGVNDDGIWGPRTNYALEVHIGHDRIHELANAYLDERLGWYDEIIERDPKQSVFAKGWVNRVENLRTEIA